MQLALRNLRYSAPALGIVPLLILSFAAPAQSPAPLNQAPQPPTQIQAQTSAASTSAVPPAPAVSQPPATPAVPLTPAQQLAADTARLQDLAAELKAAMDKSTKDTLSLAVIKKAQEVEKLAHKVRDEMRASLLHGS